MANTVDDGGGATDDYDDSNRPGSDPWYWGDDDTTDPYDNTDSGCPDGYYYDTAFGMCLEGSTDVGDPGDWTGGDGDWYSGGGATDGDGTDDGTDTTDGSEYGDNDPRLDPGNWDSDSGDPSDVVGGGRVDDQSEWIDYIREHGGVIPDSLTGGDDGTDGDGESSPTVGGFELNPVTVGVLAIAVWAMTRGD